AAVDHEKSGNIRLGRNVQTATWSARRATGGGVNLSQRLVMDSGIHLGELEQILAVIAGLGMVKGGCREPEVVLTPMRLRSPVGRVQTRCAVRRNAARQYDDR